jgi:tetratricopeptide (TPR) repeat protein
MAGGVPKAKTDSTAAARQMVEQGVALRRRGLVDEAARIYEAALMLAPDMPEAHHNLGIARRAQGRLEDAARCWERAVSLRPEFAAARNNLGSALLELGRPAEAIVQHRRVLLDNPRSLPGLINLGNALRQSGEPEQAEATYRHALAVAPDDPMALGNLGLALQDLGRLDEAEAAFRRAIAVRPDHAEARRSLGMLLLLRGRFAEGWAEYDWRWRTPRQQRRDFGCPTWRGGDIAGKTILLHAEQGLGDTIMTCRLAAAVAARGAQVVLEVQPALVRLLKGLAGVDRIVPRGAGLPPADAEASLLDLPRILGLDAASVPAKVPYLVAETDRVERWRSQIDRRPGFRVGVTWQGNPGSIADLGRSAPLAALAPLAAVPGVRLISLQKGPGSEQIWGFPAIEDLGPRFDAGGDAFLDTAAAMQCLDLVVSVDTAPAHLAGALARPVWIALKSMPDWRWMLERRGTPWYPTARLFRQQRAGDWPGVFAAMAEALRREVEGAR